MPVDYILGIIFGLLAGIMNALGSILQKSAVNRLVAGRPQGSFMGSVVRDPLWLAGLIVGFGLGLVFTLAAQNLIGPALVPALIASGLVALALASAKVLHEVLKPIEWLGIGLLVIGIALVGFSRLEIRRSEVDLLDSGMQSRAVIFSAGLALYWGLSWLAALRLKGLTRGLLLAASSGAPYCLSNLWALPFLISIGLVFSGDASPAIIIIFIVSCLILILAIVLGLWQTQECYRHAPANKVLPIQQVPQQIAPILIYVFVYQHPLRGAALALAAAGVILVICGGFLLGNRRAKIEISQTSKAQTPGE